jgi:hypothetical protein
MEGLGDQSTGLLDPYPREPNDQHPSSGQSVPGEVSTTD